MPGGGRARIRMDLKTPEKIAEIVEGETVLEIFEVSEFEDGLPVSYSEYLGNYSK